MTSPALTFRESIVFAALERAANAGEACPSNDMLAGLFQGGVGPASETVTRLERKGLIKVSRGGISRVVTIVATGAKTAGTVKKPHWRYREGAEKRPTPRYRRECKAIEGLNGNARRADAVRDPVLPAGFAPVDRTPCWRCGSRPDACQCRSAAAGVR